MSVSVRNSCLSNSSVPAPLAIVLAFRYHITIRAKTDYATTSGAVRWFERGRILEFREVVLVRAIPHVHFCRKRFATLLAILPTTVVLLIEVRAAQSEAVVIAVTRVALVGKDDVVAGVIANRIVTACGLCQCFAPRAAQPTCLPRSGCKFCHG